MLKNNSKKIVFIILSVIGLVSVLVTSYSFVNANLFANKKYVITSGLLELVLDEKEGITLSNALPVYDEVGMLSDSYNFTLTNKSKFLMKYELSLVDETTSNDVLAYEDVRYGLTKDGTTSFGSISELENMIIDKNSIASNQIIEYSLRLWVNNDVTDESRISGKSRTFRVTIETAKSDDDILLAATLDGEPVGEFPTIEDNYGVESITCNNDVSASFNPTTWSVTVDGIAKSNTSCIVNFSSDITVDETSDAITMSKSDLYAFYKGSFAGTATSSEVLSGKTVYLNGVETTGTMPNIGSVNQTLNAGGSYTIPKGYHDGTGVVTANSLASQTSGTATAETILSGYTAWVNGTKITGTARAAATSQSGSVKVAWVMSNEIREGVVNFSQTFGTVPEVLLTNNVIGGPAYAKSEVVSVTRGGFTYKITSYADVGDITLTWNATAN